MPIMLEVACIVALAIKDWADFGIIFCMLLCNGCLGFYEELKAAKSLAELTSKMEQHSDAANCRYWEWPTKNKGFYIYT